VGVSVVETRTRSRGAPPSSFAVIAEGVVALLLLVGLIGGTSALVTWGLVHGVSMLSGG
jgi:hypothetical protein